MGNTLAHISLSISPTMKLHFILSAIVLLFSQQALSERILSAKAVGDCDTGACFAEVVTQNDDLICLTNLDASGALMGERLCKTFNTPKVAKRWSHHDALIHPI